MACLDEDEDLLNDAVGLDDYDVIPRPQELIELQKQLSSPKAKPSSVFGHSKRSEVGQERKIKEKTSSKKHDRKSSSKSKPSYKSPLNESAPKKFVAKELDSRFESFLQNAKTSMLRYKSDLSKMAAKVSTDAAEESNKLINVDTNKNHNFHQTKFIGEPVVAAMDRFKALDARDATLRLLRDQKQSSSKKTKIFGTCPDMCPEKERYSRIAKNCLSVLEMMTVFDPNVLSRDANHSYMVKEYSRSSADQQEPLPHELRPIRVLVFTMDYLICNIMDLPLDNISLADWYDFIWNRTRSIRKDITQQQLCDIQCVEIIEKCVRFHIHCAEALSEEETAVFDPKINNENLTKCLQTLKHMYHDLKTKGIQCPNEAEFRSYDILLSLTEGETLRLIKDIRKDLLKSPVIRFAFDAALAFKSHNYVKFFKLIEKADYLSSCILHRYIPEARVRALQIIVRAYSTQHHSSAYPSANLVKDLKFENLAEAVEFCQSHGLEADNSLITIERKQFSKSASSLPMSRSFKLVGSKRGRSLGKIINKGELPANPLSWYQPHDSFDEKNILKTDSIGTAEKIVEAKWTEDSLQVSEVNVFKGTTVPLTTSALQTTASELPIIFITSSTTPTTSEFSFSTKRNEPFTSPKEHLFPKFSSEFSKNDLELPSTEEFFSFGQNTNTQSEAEVEHSGVEVDNEIVMEEDLDELSESSEERMMEYEEEMNEEESLQPSFNRNLLEINQVESQGSLPAEEISCPFAPLDKSVLEVLLGSESVLPFGEKSNIQTDNVPKVMSSDDLSVPDLLEDLIEDSSSELLDKTDEEDRQKSELSEIMEGLGDELLSGCIQEHSLSLCEEVINEEKEKMAQLEDELELIRSHLAFKTILKWRYFCERKRQRKMLESSTFCSPWQPMLLNIPYVTTGVVSPVVAYKKHCSLSYLTAEKIKRRKEVAPGWEEFKPEDVWPLKAFKPYPRAYLGKSEIQFFFKLCIVFPAVFDSAHYTTFINWICIKFSLQRKEKFQFDATNTLLLHNGKMLISVRALQLGPQTSSSYKEFLDGITAMILLVTPSSESNRFYEDFALLLDSDTLQYSYPLFTYILEQNQASSRLISFLQEKLDARYFTEFKIECLPELQQFAENSKKVLNGLLWLLEIGKKDSLHPLLYKCNFTNYLEDSFASAFNILLCKISLDEFKCLRQMPHQIIDFYNKVLKFRSSLLCSDLLERICSSWPPTEVKAHLGDEVINLETQNKFKRKIECLLLPNLEDDSLDSSNIADYVKRVGILAGNDREILFVRIRNMLENSSAPLDWLSILNVCALHLISVQNSECLLLNEDNIIFYTKEDLEAFDSEEFWVDIPSDGRLLPNLTCAKRKNNSTFESPVKKSRWDWTSEKISPKDENLERKENFISSAFDMPDIFSCQRENLFAPLKAAIAKQAEESEAFINQLNTSAQNAYSLVEDEIPKESEIFMNEIPSACEKSCITTPFSKTLNSGVDVFGFPLDSSSRISLSSIADKISELRYNIQKGNIVEDHFSRLLSNEICQD